MIAFSVRISMLISLALLLAAQAFFIPAALAAVLGVIWLYLLHAALKPQAQLKKIWTLLLTLTALASIYFSYKTFIGVEAGVSVLSVFLFAKALETKTQRDAIILFNFALFVSASSFLLSQSFAMAVMVLLCLISNFIGLYRLQTSLFPKPQNSSWSSLKQDAGHVGRFMLYALPFFVLLFMFFPRLPPLWHIPVPQDKAVTGISDTMSPGDISQLSQSSALAFRVVGDMRQLPPRSELYWRALVLDEYDGTRWTSSYGNQQLLQQNEIRRLKLPDQSHPHNNAQFEYRYLPADPLVNWIMGLEKSMPLDSQYQQGKDWRITSQRQVLKNEPIHLLWIGLADLSIQDEQQRNWLNKRNTQVIEQKDLKAQQLSKTLYQQSGYNPEQYIQRVLNWYRHNGFSYTLSPGILGANRIDDFLFGARQGFCEHYASSFVMLMRYAGIPARVVTGYQGGQLAPDGKSWEVRQLDAHAWTEVWLNGQWQRIDPTAIIAPNRVDEGMQNYIENNDSVLGGKQSSWSYRQHAFLTKMRIWSDYASYQWQSKVVGYNAEAQQSRFQKIGLNSVYSAAVSLIASMLFLLLLYFAYIYWQARQGMPEAERAIARFNRQLPDHFKKHHAETFAVWMKRISVNIPQEKQIYFQQLQQHYEQYAYMPNGQQKEKMKEIKISLKTCASVLKKL
ncbi:transglutaminaseTgpA domain-containing protein [Acinetobacter sp.]|uniref:transglutaminase family protein n=1 Tax=Acinetobacter sp. TaxID=472 RepID=UPI0035B131EF